MEVDTETAAPVILILSGGVVVLAILTIFLLFTRPGKAIVQQGAMFTKTMVAGATQIFGAGDSPAGGSPFGPSTPTYGELQVLQGMNQGQIIPINRERFVLGRELAAGCDYVIPQPFVSSKHCEIATRGNQTWIQDLGSSNRTYVDGVPLNPHQEVQLRDGATIGISSHIQIRFNAPQPVQSTGGWGSKKTQLDFSQSTQLDTGYKPPMEQPTRLDMKPPMEHPTQINMPGKPPLEQPTQINMQPPPKEEPTQIFSKPPMEQPTQINFSPPTTPEPSSGWMDDPTQLPEDTLPDGIDPDTQYSKDRGLEGNRPSQGRRNPDDFDLPGDNDHPPVKDDWEI
jgi:pSer/pThr/pTyr-binding forkhead associated (FHA) protein